MRAKLTQRPKSIVFLVVSFLVSLEIILLYFKEKNIHKKKTNQRMRTIESRMAAMSQHQRKTTKKKRLRSSAKRRIQLVKMKRRLRKAIEEERIDEVAQLLSRPSLSKAHRVVSRHENFEMFDADIDEIQNDLHLIETSIANVIETSAGLTPNIDGQNYEMSTSTNVTSSFLSLKRPASRENLPANAKQV